MIPVREAIRRVLENLPAPGREEVAVTAAHGRVLAEDVRSEHNVPGFRNSAMDGYAVRSADLAGASSAAVRLHVTGLLPAGAVAEQPLAAGCAARIMTGAMVPEGADAVVRQEDVIAEGDGQASFSSPVASGANIRMPGEDLRCDEVVLRAGRCLRSADIGVLVSAGRAMVRVARRPRVAILATGDELVGVGRPVPPGKVANSNGPLLAAAVEEVGGVAVPMGIVRDDRAGLEAAFAEALRADVVLSTGGVSVGSFDYVREVLGVHGYEERFWKVAQKPGKPLSFGFCGPVPVFGLPGNPVSSLVCFLLYVAPALRRMSGHDAVYPACARATAAEDIRKSEKLTDFVRAIATGSADALQVRSTGTQSSGALRSMSAGNVLIVGPPGVRILETGRRITVVFLDPHPPQLEPYFLADLPD